MSRLLKTKAVIFAWMAVMVAFVVVVAPGCGGGSIKLETDRSVISAGGCDKALITATVSIDGKARSGKVVTFETTAGSFSKIEESTYVDVTTGAGGKATVELFATTSVGTASVTASFSDDNFSDTSSVSVVFGPPSGEFAPVSDRLSLECDAENVGAFRSGNSDIAVTCNFTASTADGCTLPLSAFVGTDNLIVSAEAGTLEAAADYWSNESLLIYRTIGGNPEPLDVEPVTGEPSRAGPLGETLNPRDGVVTLFVAVLGREGYTDVNGNGVFDEDTEPFDDVAEPFLDADDDGLFTLGTDPLFADSNGDGEHTDLNGQYDATAFVGVSTKIVWTGDLEEHAEAARLEPGGSENIPNGGSLTIRIHLLDARLNPVAGFEQAGDYVVYDITGYVQVTPSAYQAVLVGGSAISWDDFGRYQEYHPDAAVYEVRLSDDDPSWDYDPAVAWTMAVQVLSSPGPDGEGGYGGQRQYDFQQTLQGTSR